MLSTVYYVVVSRAHLFNDKQVLASFPNVKIVLRRLWLFYFVILFLFCFLVRLLREELQLLQEQGSYVGEVVRAMDKKKVLVKVKAWRHQG